ncbi:Clavaminate synthase-like protein [Auriscalpium vulgare]|uniref:Clavaminate synthase-like protein n=1 Tax=Auriscalpium vulgare TaxID=40419 RepID=A0ACB8RBL6_9AGAM|nr:Clavaminate synthase-like protein [Auriscalpium vulgare]
MGSLSVPAVNAAFPYRWLRDSCQCNECVHPTTQQKLHRTSDIQHDVAPKEYGVRTADDGVHVAWDNGHTSFYPASFLERHASPGALAAFRRDPHFAKVPWDAKAMGGTDGRFVDYAALRTERGLLAGIEQLARYGLLFVTGIPNEDTSDEGCEARRLADTLGVLRPTFYGDTWDVKNIVNSINIAYTNLYLGLHSDLQYFEHPPRFQILHCIRNRVKGGTSLFVDALRAATVLRERAPADFDVLTTTPVPFHYVNDGHHLHRRHPTIQLADIADPATGVRDVAYVNYSPPFQAPLAPDTPPAFYGALERFAALLEEEGATFRYLLRETDAVVFDNRRVLHARTAFEDAGEVPGEEAGTPNRWLKGCYFDADSLLDRGRVLSMKAEKGLLT